MRSDDVDPAIDAVEPFGPAGLRSLLHRIERLREDAASPRVIIGIAGAPGSGKTTLATALVQALAGAEDWRESSVAHVPMDGFHLADDELVRLGRLARKGAPDTFDAGGYAALLARIRDGESVWAPGFERDLEQPIAQALPVGEQVHTVVSEGNYLLLPDPQWQQARARFDEVWFCRTAEQVRRERLIARHVRFGKSPETARAWVAAVDEPNAAAVVESEGAADLIIDI